MDALGCGQKNEQEEDKGVDADKEGENCDYRPSRQKICKCSLAAVANTLGDGGMVRTSDVEQNKCTVGKSSSKLVPRTLRPSRVIRRAAPCKNKSKLTLPAHLCLSSLQRR